MKCVKLKFHHNLVVRVSDDEADELIRKGDATYSTKGAWKRYGRQYGVPGQ